MIASSRTSTIHIRAQHTSGLVVGIPGSHPGGHPGGPSSIPGVGIKRKGIYIEIVFCFPILIKYCLHQIRGPFL